MAAARCAYSAWPSAVEFIQAEVESFKSIRREDAIPLLAQRQHRAVHAASGGVEDEHREREDLLREEPAVDVLVVAHFLADCVEQLHEPDLVLRHRRADGFLDDLRYVGGKVDVPPGQIGQKAELAVAVAQLLPQLPSEV